MAEETDRGELPAVDVPRELFRAGRVQLRVGSGLNLRGLSIGGVLALVEGWQPAYAMLDVGVLNIRAVSVGVGVEVGESRQLLVNPMLQARGWLADHLPRFLAGRLDPGSLADYAWTPEDRMFGGRLTLHLHKPAGHPYAVLLLDQHRYRLRVEDRQSGQVVHLGGRLRSVGAGAGAVGVTKSGFLVSVEARVMVAVSNTVGAVADFGDGEGPTVPGRMRPPPRFLFFGGVGYRL